MPIQEKVDSICVPACIGRILGKIASGFSDFTAEQWMVWTIVHSPFVLKDILPQEHYSMWCTFSLSCSLFCRPYIHHTELVKADELMMKFCTMFERIFGPQYVAHTRSSSTMYWRCGGLSILSGAFHLKDTMAS